jgi:2'-5' RNA ligase
MAGNLNLPRDVYEKLWQNAARAFDKNIPRLDPFLKNRSADSRRGVSLAARPDAAVRGRVLDFLTQMNEVAPGQYLYQPEQIHLTVFSIIPGSEFWRQRFDHLPDYLAALDEVLKNRPAFSVTFRGVTASPEAVMIQGFPDDASLEKLRDDLRAALISRDLGENLDARYKIVTAHLTVARFQTSLPDWQPLKAFLAAQRNTDFGATRIGRIELIEGDWYASPDSVQLLREYPLS